MNGRYLDHSSSAAVFNIGLHTGFNLARRIVSRPEYQWHKRALDQLNELVALEKGWDGYRALPVRFDTANFALQMLESACGEYTPCPQIVPGANGDMQIEWHFANGDIELHVRGPLQVSGWALIDGVEHEAELTNDFTVAAGWLSSMADQQVAAAAAA
jgi:hypothetical protein